MCVGASPQGTEIKKQKEGHGRKARPCAVIPHFIQVQDFPRLMNKQQNRTSVESGCLKQKHHLLASATVPHASITMNVHRAAMFEVKLFSSSLFHDMMPSHAHMQLHDMIMTTSHAHHAGRRTARRATDLDHNREVSDPLPLHAVA